MEDDLVGIVEDDDAAGGADDRQAAVPRVGRLIEGS